MDLMSMLTAKAVEEKPKQKEKKAEKTAAKKRISPKERSTSIRLKSTLQPKKETFHISLKMVQSIQQMKSPRQCCSMDSTSFPGTLRMTTWKRITCLYRCSSSTKKGKYEISICNCGSRRYRLPPGQRHT